MKTNYLELIPDHWEHMAKVFQALGDQHRQRLLLCFEPGERLSPGQLSEVSNLSRTAVTHHLQLLHAANILVREKQGRDVKYHINTTFMKDTLNNVLSYVHTLEEPKV